MRILIINTWAKIILILLILSLQMIVTQYTAFESCQLFASFLIPISNSFLFIELWLPKQPTKNHVHSSYCSINHITYYSFCYHYCCYCCHTSTLLYSINPLSAPALYLQAEFVSVNYGLVIITAITAADTEELPNKPYANIRFYPMGLTYHVIEQHLLG